MSKKDKRIEAALYGAMSAWAVGFSTLPVFVIFNMQPVFWFVVTVGAMPFGALIGLGFRWVYEAPADDKPKKHLPENRSAEPAISFNPSDWTGR